jgi:hypothetical protein
VSKNPVTGTREPVLYGFFSASCAKQCGYCLYLNAVGQPVFVTEVRYSVNVPTGMWPDQVAVGRVMKYVRRINGNP